MVGFKNVTGPVRPLSAKGMHADNWCDQLCTVHLQSTAQVSSANLQLWFPPKMEGDDIYLSVNAGLPGEISIMPPRDSIVFLELFFPMQVNEIATLTLSCDNLHLPLAPDVRVLSFVLSRLDFS